MAKQAVKCSEEIEFQVEEKKIPSLGGITTAKPYGYIWLKNSREKEFQVDEKNILPLTTLVTCSCPLRDAGAPGRGQDSQTIYIGRQKLRENKISG